MRIHDPIAEGEEPYNLIPLTDMVFNLLIFFMCATTFVQVEKEMALQLPRAGAVAAMNASGVNQQVIINIRQDGKIIVSGKELDASGLAGVLSARDARQKDQPVIIRADQRSIVKYFADVTRVCKEAGVKEIKLVYIEPAAARE